MLLSNFKRVEICNEKNTKSIKIIAELFLLGLLLLFQMIILKTFKVIQELQCIKSFVDKLCSILLHYFIYCFLIINGMVFLFPPHNNLTPSVYLVKACYAVQFIEVHITTIYYNNEMLHIWHSIHKLGINHCEMSGYLFHLLIAVKLKTKPI